MPAEASWPFSASSSACTLTRVLMRGEANASVRPSAKIFRLSVVIRISRPGKNVTHQWPDSSSILPSDSMLPQVGVFTEVMPAPMNDSDASKTIASATSTVAKTMIGAAQLRATCLPRIHQVRAPTTLDAET